MVGRWTGAALPSPVAVLMLAARGIAEDTAEQQRNNAATNDPVITIVATAALMILFGFIYKGCWREEQFEVRRLATERNQRCVASTASTCTYCSPTNF